MLIEFKEWHNDEADTPIHVDPTQVSAISSYRYHSFRSAVTKIVLHNGREFILAHDPAWVSKNICRALEVEEVE